MIDFTELQRKAEDAMSGGFITDVRVDPRVLLPLLDLAAAPVGDTEYEAKLHQLIGLTCEVKMMSYDPAKAIQKIDERDAMRSRLVADRARLVAEVQRLREACAAFVEWIDSDSVGPTYPEGVTRDAPGGEAIWRQWWDGQHVLCAKAIDLARAALAKAAPR